MNNRTIPIPIVRQADDLETLVAGIKADMHAGEQSGWALYDSRRAAGAKLVKLKEQCKGERGKFGRVMRDNFEFKRTYAWYLMEYSKCSRREHLEEEEELWQQIKKSKKKDAPEETAAAPPADDQPEPPAPGSLWPDEQEEEESPARVVQPLSGFITLAQWEEAADRAALLKADGGSYFNSQGDNDNIEWALWSWNPVTGCKHDCPYCYARDIAERFYPQKFEPSVWPARLSAPRNTPYPADKIAEAKAAGTLEGDVKAAGLRNVFVCSMADLFGRWVPSEWIEAVLQQVRAAPQWTFLFLTKFPIRMAEFDFPANTWVGTTVDCQARVANAERAFRKVKCGVKWLSLEPLIEPLKFSDLGAFDWVVIGGSSRSSQTPEWMPPRQWVQDIEAEVWRAGGRVYEKSNLMPAGGWPRVRQYPGIDAEAAQPIAPDALRYLPSVEAKS